MRPRTVLGLCLLATACGGDSPPPSGGEEGSGGATQASSAPTTTVGSTSDHGSEASTAHGSVESSTGMSDCNGADPTGSPGAAEVCDGVDQDCDGDIDEGVPNDGAGCIDPGPPDPPEVVGIVTISIHNVLGDERRHRLRVRGLPR